MLELWEDSSFHQLRLTPESQAHPAAMKAYTGALAAQSCVIHKGSVWRVDAQPKQWRLTVGADTGAMETHLGTVEAHPTLEAMKTLLVTAEARSGVVATHQ